MSRVSAMQRTSARFAGPALDLAGILIFVVIGRAVHDHGVDPAGIVATAWPFTVGLVAGAVGTRAWRTWQAIVPTGIAIWLSTVAVGMILRQISGQGIALAFVGVALAFLAAMMLGWRVVWRLAEAMRLRRT